VKNQRYIIAFGESLFPLLCFFIWNWDLHFVFLFYYLDILASLVVSIIKLRKIDVFRKGSWVMTNYLSSFIRWYLLILLGLSAFEMGILVLYNDINLITSLVDFLKYEEFGIPQGVVLLPLVFLMNYQNYSMLFVKNGLYRLLPSAFIIQQSKYNFMLFALAGILFLVFTNVMKFPPFIWIWIIVLSRFAYDCWGQPYLEKKIAQNISK
jgi:hypothetical protein